MQLQRVALIRAKAREELPHSKLEWRSRLSTQACPQSVWEKAEAWVNTRRRRGGRDQGERRGRERGGDTNKGRTPQRRERGRGERGID